LLALLLILTRSGEVQAQHRGHTAEEAPELIVLGEGFTQSVIDLAFRPDGRWLAASSADKTVRIWDVDSGNIVRTLLGYSGKGPDGACTALKFTPNGSDLLVAVREPAGAAIRVYHPADFPERDRIIERVPCHAGSFLKELAISRDGRHLVSIGMDGVLLSWDWPKRRVLGEDRVEGRIIDVSFPTDAPIAAVVVDAGEGPSLRFWSALHGKRFERLAPPERAALPGGAAGLDGLIRDAQHQLDQIAAVPAPETESVSLIKYQFRERAIAEGGFTQRAGKNGPDYWVRFRSLDDGKESSPLEAPPRYFPHSLTFNPARRLAAYGDRMGQIVVWDVATGKNRLQKRGEAVYTAAFTRGGKDVVFGHTPDTASNRWADNRYGTPEWTFDLEELRVSQGATREVPAARLDLGPAHIRRRGPVSDQTLPEPLRKVLTDSLWYSRDDRPGAAGLYPRALYNGCIWSYSFLESQHLGFADPIVMGTELGELFCLDPGAWLERRSFLGHSGAVTAVGERPDGKLLVSGSMDGTVRLWSLQDVERKAFPDFAIDFFTGRVTFVPPTGPSAQSGIRPGDVWKTMDGREFGEVVDDFLRKKWNYQAGQPARLIFAREGQDYTVDLPLVAYGDVVDPLVSLYVAPDGEWVAWTPEGYYAASMQGDRLIGWRANRGRGEPAAYYEAQQLRSLLHKPEILQKVIKTGKRAQTIDPTLINTRVPEEFHRVEPPHVEIQDLPAETTQTRYSLRVKLSGNVHHHEVFANVVYQDGAWWQSWPTAVQRDEMEVEVEIMLREGLNQVEVTAQSLDSAEGVSVTERIVCKPSEHMQPPLPKAYVLAIGVGRFEDRKHFEPLDYPVKDARAFLKVWQQQEGRLYSKVYPKLLADEQATRDAIRSEVKNIVEAMLRSPDDTVLAVFISTHGKRDDLYQNFNLIPYNGREEDLENTAIDSMFWYKQRQAIRSPFYLFLDTCHAGSVAFEQAHADRYMRELFVARSPMLVFAASGRKQEAGESQIVKHGYFTRAFVDLVSDPRHTIDDDPEDQWIGVRELGKHLKRRVRELSGDRQDPVVPPPNLGTTRFLSFVKWIE
jgi:WD40 repeat protein